jgi:hypothetical protein
MKHCQFILLVSYVPYSHITQLHEVRPIQDLVYLLFNLKINNLAAKSSKLLCD